MEDLTRLIISHERIENIKNNNLELSKEESHYLNKVMRIKNGKKIFIILSSEIINLVKSSI